MNAALIVQLLTDNLRKSLNTFWDALVSGGEIPPVYPAPAVRNFRGDAGNRARWRTEAPSIERGGNGATVHLNHGACGLLDRGVA